MKIYISRYISTNHGNLLPLSIDPSMNKARGGFDMGLDTAVVEIEELVVASVTSFAISTVESG